MAEPRTIIYILSPPRSGSTLLGAVLGSHPGAVHIGEVVAPLRKGLPVLCRYCAEGTCPLWGRALDEPFLRQTFTHFQDYRTGGGPVAPPHDTIYRRVFDTFSGARWVLDTSKNIPWAQYHVASSRDEVRFLFLRRDLRAAWFAHKRTHGRAINDVPGQLASKVLRLQAFSEELPDTAKVDLRYEDLVTQPEATLRRVCAGLGLPFDSRMLDFSAEPHHVIGGNPGLVAQFRRELAPSAVPSESPYYQPAGPGIQADDRWRDAWTEADERMFEGALGGVNRQWGYPEPVRQTIAGGGAG